MIRIPLYRTLLCTAVCRPCWSIVALLLALAGNPAFADGDLTTKFSNQNSVGNTRHNLTQRQASGGGPVGVIMDPYRNDYGQICVYCHTPHNANAAVSAPLWNRNIPNTTYRTYDQVDTNTLTQTVYQPGAASLTCLSCHDGQQAVDAVMKMPGPGRYSATPDNAFLNTWRNPSGTGPFTHMRLAQGECLACHSSTAGFLGAGATDFSVFVIGTDLTNDHPVGVTFPTSDAGGDWKMPGGSKTTNGLVTKYFDENNNGRMDKGEIRLYDSGHGPSVECASCHDPHGVAPNGSSTFNPTFLRKSNTASAVCLTCHTK